MSSIRVDVITCVWISYRLGIRHDGHIEKKKIVGDITFHVSCV